MKIYNMLNKKMNQENWSASHLKFMLEFVL